MPVPRSTSLAIFLTARVLGIELGVARVVGTMVFGVVIGILMAVIFRRSEEKRTQATLAMPDPPASRRPLWQNAAMLAAMLAFLIFSDWFNPGDKHVELADGTRFEATLQYETEGAYDLRLKQAAFGHNRPRSSAWRSRNHEHRRRRHLGHAHPPQPLVSGRRPWAWSSSSCVCRG